MELLEHAIRLFESKNYEKAFKCFYELVTKDDMICEYYLGLCYQNGLGVLKDNDEAFYWFKKSAERGYANSQYELGLKYSSIQYNFDSYLALEDDEIENSDIIAFECYQKAASQGHKKAQIELAICYLLGNGTLENREKGMELLLKNTDHLDSDVSFAIALQYYFDENKIEEAIKWYIKSHEEGNFQASEQLAKIYKEEKEDYVNSLYWYQKAAENGNEEAMFEIGNIYYFGIGLEKNIEEAIKWYQKAAVYNQFDALKRLGILYFEGLYVKQDIEKGIKYLIDANKIRHYGDEIIEMHLEMIYKKGFDLGEHNLKYEALFKARLGDFNSQIEFGYKYLSSNAPKKYKNELVGWLIESAQKGNKDAQYLVGMNYDSLDEIENKKYEWLEKAASQDHKRAQYILAKEFANPKDSIKLYTSASEEIFEAKLELGYIYGHIERDYQKAYEWYQKAGMQLNKIDERHLAMIKVNSWKYGNIEVENLANLGNKDAQILLGCLYEYGFEYEKNINKALYWYELSFKRGFEKLRVLVE